VETMNAPRLNEEEMKILRESVPINFYEQHR